MTAELKPCPFCGGEASEFKDRGHSTAYNVGCFNNYCTTEPNTWAGTKAEAIAAWNTRADLSQVAITAAMIGAMKRADGIAGNTKDYDREHRRAAGQIGALIKASISTDAAAALGAALVGAYKEGWSDGAANCHHDRNETPHEGWLISDTYKSIPTDAAAALEAVKAQVRDDTVRSAAIAAGNAIVRLATNADPDNSPLRKQMLRVKMEKAVKAAFTRDA